MGQKIIPNKSFNYAGFSNLPNSQSGALFAFSSPLNSLVVFQDSREIF